MPEQVDMIAMLESLRLNAERSGHRTIVSFSGDPHVTLKPNAIKRCLTNLVDNACRYGDEVRIAGVRGATWLTVTIDDDGPGLPEEMRETVFRPFFRLDDARNQDRRGTGLGLSIARDVARGHGGDITLSESALGGLRVSLRIPV
jgi:two-component system, OmpR family, osmolarity sensor histidine kinase EnvZ